MSLEVDGAAILKALVRNPRAFAMNKADINLIAAAAVAARLKRRLELSDLRSLAKAIGQIDFRTIVGDLSGRDAKSLARLDAAHPHYATADAHWHRAHVIRLATGDAEPTTARPARSRSTPSRDPEAATRKMPKIGRIMASAAQASAARTRRGYSASKSRP